MNHEIEISDTDADKMRAKIATKKDHEPLVTGRDWGWTDCVRYVVIEADSYSTAANGAAHFYRIPYGTEYSRTSPGKLVYSVATPVTIGIEDDEGMTEKGTGGLGKVPWYPPGKIPWTAWGKKVERAGVTVPTADVPLTFDELRTLRNWLKMLDPDKKSATDDRLDDWLRQYQRELEGVE